MVRVAVLPQAGFEEYTSNSQTGEFSRLGGIGFAYQVVRCDANGRNVLVGKIIIVLSRQTKERMRKAQLIEEIVGRVRAA